jgi:hypothetical protein
MDQAQESGVGGWLLFFIVTLALFSPLASIVSIAVLVSSPQAAGAYGELWPRIQAAEIALVAAQSVICWFASYRLIARHEWRSVQITIAVLVVMLLLGILIEPLMVSLIADIPVDRLLSGMATPELVRPFFYTALWTTYLLRSRRVAATYPRYSLREELAAFE